MNYYTASELAEICNISSKRIRVLCNEGRIAGAIKKGTQWLIPTDAQKPVDKRVERDR